MLADGLKLRRYFGGVKVSGEPKRQLSFAYCEAWKYHTSASNDTSTELNHIAILHDMASVRCEGLVINLRTMHRAQVFKVDMLILLG